MISSCGRSLFISLIVTLGSHVAMAQCTADSVECIHLTLEPNDSGYLLGKPIMVNMVFTNLSDHDLPLDLIHAGDQGYGYHFEVTNLGKSKRLERTEVGKEIAFEIMRGGNPRPDQPMPDLIMGGGQVPLPPHQSKSFPTFLSRIFEFREPGNYRVEVLGVESRLYVAPITIVVQP